MRRLLLAVLFGVVSGAALADPPPYSCGGSNYVWFEDLNGTVVESATNFCSDIMAAVQASALAVDPSGEYLPEYCSDTDHDEFGGISAETGWYIVLDHPMWGGLWFNMTRLCSPTEEVDIASLPLAHILVGLMWWCSFCFGWIVGK